MCGDTWGSSGGEQEQSFSATVLVFNGVVNEISRNSAGQVTLNLYGGKFYKGGDKGSSSIWDRRPGHKGTKSRLSNLKSTFFTPIGTQSTYKRSKASRKYCPEEDQTVSSFQWKSTN